MRRFPLCEGNPREMPRPPNHRRPCGIRTPEGIQAIPPPTSASLKPRQTRAFHCAGVWRAGAHEHSKDQHTDQSTPALAKTSPALKSRRQAPPLRAPPSARFRPVPRRPGLRLAVGSGDGRELWLVEARSREHLRRLSRGDYWASSVFCLRR